MAILQPLEGSCPRGALAAFSEAMGSQIFRVNALVLTNAFLVGVLVGIGAYRRRYRHHPLARYLFRGATILFLPIISYVVSSVSNEYIISLPFEGEILTGSCSPRDHIFLVLVWTGLVQVVGINTTAVVAADAREAGRGEEPPVLLLVYAFWTGYLAIYTGGRAGYTRGYYFPEFVKNVLSLRGLLVVLLFDLIFAKMVLMYYAYYMAKRSFALGRNPRLIVAYMEQLHEEGGRCQRGEQADGGEHIPPPLIVTGEDTVHVEKQPHGYRMDMNSSGLVTLDKVWKLDNVSQQLKDVCLSFALFKLLRCRFARYTVSKASRAKLHNFIWNSVLLNNRGDGPSQDTQNNDTPQNKEERVFRVIIEELCFLHDYYYSSHPISYTESWLYIFGLVMSVLSIGYCLLVATLQALMINRKEVWQIPCEVQCRRYSKFQGYGNLVFDLVPVFLLLALVILSEVKDIASYICSNWTKVAIIRHLVNHASRQKSLTVQKWVGFVLRRCNYLYRHWADEMNQCSILALHPRKTPMTLLRCLFPRLPEEKENVEVPGEVKAAVMDALRRSMEQLRDGIAPSLPVVQTGGSILLECSGKGTTYTLLVWHIATSIFEVRHPNSASDHKVAATKLSRYCAYLVAYTPELLPGDDECSTSLYRAVKKNAKRVLAGAVAVSTPEERYQQLVDLLGEKSKDELGEESEKKVLSNGARLGKLLVEEMVDEGTTWRLLAGFWSDMLLYMAPSDNLDGHAEAIARGGELITLLWALLTHVGIVARPHSDDTAAATDSAPDAVSIIVLDS